MDLKPQRNKQDYINNVMQAFKEYEEHKKDTIDKYTRVRQLGCTGKDGTTYLVKTKSGREYAMKTFKKQKSDDAIMKEIELQKIASKNGISPKIRDYDTVFKYIVMDKLDENLYDILKSQKWTLTIDQQHQLIKLFQTLDEIKILHNDPNPLNFMLKNGKMYIIDFGLSKKIDTALTDKLKSDSPNMKFMIVGFLLKIREIHPTSKFKELEKHVSKDDKKMFGF
jgi:tRNA A-37 threonylcarbamoyl transferase component Bud32